MLKFKDINFNWWILFVFNLINYKKLLLFVLNFVWGMGFYNVFLYQELLIGGYFCRFFIYLNSMGQKMIMNVFIFKC